MADTKTALDNVKSTVKGDILTIVVDLSKDFGPSKSGKTISVASTLGNIAVEGHEGFKLGLNVYKPNPDK